MHFLSIQNSMASAASIKVTLTEFRRGLGQSESIYHLSPGSP